MTSFMAIPSPLQDAGLHEPRWTKLLEFQSIMQKKVTFDQK